jgi:hypothetical protein
MPLSNTVYVVTSIDVGSEMELLGIMGTEEEGMALKQNLEAMCKYSPSAVSYYCEAWAIGETRPSFYSKPYGANDADDTVSDGS